MIADLTLWNPKYKEIIMPRIIALVINNQPTSLQTITALTEQAGCNHILQVTGHLTADNIKQLVDQLEDNDTLVMSDFSPLDNVTLLALMQGLNQRNITLTTLAARTQVNGPNPAALIAAATACLSSRAQDNPAALTCQFYENPPDFLLALCKKMSSVATIMNALGATSLDPMQRLFTILKAANANYTGWNYEVAKQSLQKIRNELNTVLVAFFKTHLQPNSAFENSWGKHLRENKNTIGHTWSTYHLDHLSPNKPDLTQMKALVTEYNKLITNCDAHFHTFILEEQQETASLLGQIQKAEREAEEKRRNHMQSTGADMLRILSNGSFAGPTSVFG